MKYIKVIVPHSILMHSQQVSFGLPALSTSHCNSLKHHLHPSSAANKEDVTSEVVSLQQNLLCFKGRIPGDNELQIEELHLSFKTGTLLLDI